MPFKNPPPLYSVWQGMRRRCRNPNFKQWADYGGRGISICRRWDSYKAFERDMWPRSDGSSLERIDPNGDYSPQNCRWASQKEQMRNQRRTIYVVVEGIRYKAIELADLSGLKVDTIVKRAKDGLPYDKLICKTYYINPNNARKAIEARVAKQKAQTHCKHGHEFSPQNTGLNSAGNRFCRTCHRIKTARQRAGKRKPLAPVAV